MYNEGKKIHCIDNARSNESSEKELGESAVILDSREIKTSRFFGLFGKRNIEVLAAVDPKPTRIRQSSREEANGK